MAFTDTDWSIWISNHPTWFYSERATQALSGKIIPQIITTDEKLERWVFASEFLRQLWIALDLSKKNPVWNSVFVVKVADNSLWKLGSLDMFDIHPNQEAVMRAYNDILECNVDEIPFENQWVLSYYIIPQAYGVRIGEPIGICDDVQWCFQYMEEEFAEMDKRRWEWGQIIDI